MPQIGHGSNEGNTGAAEQAQRTQNVSPIGLVVNGLHCAASHTHTPSLRCRPHVPTFEPCRNLATFWQKWPKLPVRRSCRAEATIFQPNRKRLRDSFTVSLIVW